MSQALSHEDQSGLPAVQTLENLVSDVLAECRKQGASSCEASVSYGEGLSVNVRMGEVETLEFNRDRGLGLTVYLGQRKGSASTSDWSATAIRDTVAAAVAIARYTSEDEYAGLAEAELMAQDIPDLDLYHPWDLSAEQAIDLAKRGEYAAREFDPRITNSEGAGVSSYQGVSVYGNSHGFIGGYRGSRHGYSCSVVASDKGSMQRDYWYESARDAGDLGEIEDVGRRAAERTVRRLNGRKLGTQQVPVIYAAELAGGILGHFTSAIRGSRLYRKSSFLLDQLGEAVFPDFVRIHEQPHLPKAMGSTPFDNEGVATRARDLIQQGVLQSYVLSSYSARKLGLQTTGNAGGVHNLIIEPSEYDQAALIKQMHRGLLITELMGQGINLVTGDYSRGAAGFWVEQGEIQYPVEEITVAGNLKEMFKNLQAVGNDVDTRGNIRSGSLLIDGMTVAGE